MNDNVHANGYVHYSFLVRLLLFISAGWYYAPPSHAFGSYITVLADDSTCAYASSVFVDSTGILFATCGASDDSTPRSALMIDPTSNPTPVVTTLLNGTQCSTATSVMRHPITGVVYVACDVRVISLTLSNGGSSNVQEVVNATNCLYPTHITLSYDGRFLLVTCQAAIIRIDLNTSTFTQILDYECEAVISYWENSREFIIAACDENGFFRKDLSTGATEILIADVQCQAATGISRDSLTGILYFSCQASGIFLLRPGDVNSTAIATHAQCPFAQHVLQDSSTNITYALCSDGDILGITSESAVLVVSHDACTSPSGIAIVDGAIVLSCFQGGVIRASGSTLSTTLSYSDCQTPSSIFIDNRNGAFVSACAFGIIAVKDNSVVRLTNEGQCNSAYDMVQDPFTGLIYASCGAKGLISINTTSRAVSTVIETEVNACSYLQGIYEDADAGYIYVACNDWGISQYNMSNGNMTFFVPISETCTVGYGIDMIRSSQTIVLACLIGGVQTISSNGTTTKYADSICEASSILLVGDIIFASCFQSPQPVIMINGSDIVKIGTSALCVSGNGLTHSTSGTVLVACRGGTASVFSIDLLTLAITIVVPGSQCTDTAMAVQDPKTQALAIACRNLGVLFATTNFRCTPGTAWVAGSCVPCKPQSYRSEFSISPMTQCRLCPDGFVAPLSGSASCSPCPAGSYDSNKACLLCPLGKYQPSSSGTTACIDCSPGSYAIFPGSTICSLCDAGFYSATNGSVSCFPCDRGSASSSIGLTHSCDGCPAGSYQNGVGKTSCIDCEPHTYAERDNSTSCTRCSSEVNADRTSCTVITCDPNSEFNEVTSQCQLCPLSTYSSRGGLCSTCPARTYTPAAGSGCASCDGIEGLECFGGIASVSPGYWAYLSDQVNWTSIPGVGPYYPLYQTAPCPQSFCQGSLLQLDAAHINVTIQYCASPRLNSANNTLCAQCEVNYLAWGDSCVACEKVNGALAFGYLVFSLALVIFLLTSSSSTSSAASTSIFLFFIQTAALEMGPIAQFLDWIQIIGNLDPKSAGTCLAPWSAYDQTLFALLIPLILIGELVVIGLIHFSLHRWLLMASPAASNQSATTTTNWSTTLLDRLKRFSLNDYRIGVISILLFCFTQVATACLKYLHCVEVGQESINFSAPTINCRSSEYKRYLGAVLFALIGYIIGFPVMAFITLWRHRESLYLPADSDALRSSTSIASFMLRWAPFYRMYHPRAYYWQCWILLRRVAFVVTSVLLLQESSKRFMTFNFLHFGSLLLHQFVKPYEDNRLNYIETISYALLICVSQLLMGFNPPYPVSVQALLFVLIVPTAAVMIGFIGNQRFKQWREGRSESMAAPFENAAEPSMEPVSVNGVTGTAAIEMNSIAGSPTSDEPHPIGESILPTYTLDSEQHHL